MLAKFEAVIAAVDMLVDMIFKRTEVATNADVADMLIGLDTIPTIVDVDGISIMDNNDTVLVQ